LFLPSHLPDPYILALASEETQDYVFRDVAATVTATATATATATVTWMYPKRVLIFVPAQKLVSILVAALGEKLFAPCGTVLENEGS